MCSSDLFPSHDKHSDKELCRLPLSTEDAMVKSAIAMSYEKDKHALINIINGRKWNDNGEESQ